MILWRQWFFSHLIGCFAVVFYAPLKIEVPLGFIFSLFCTLCLCYICTSFPGELSLSGSLLSISVCVGGGVVLYSNICNDRQLVCHLCPDKVQGTDWEQIV